jgi:putative DNA primase/helicase
MLAFDAAGVPREIAQYEAWVNWRRVARDGRVTKVPFTPQGRLASTKDSQTWSSFEDVQKATGFDGVGIVLVDELVGIDLDKCFGEDGKLEPWAQDIVDRFPNAYVERSPSNKGLHVLCRGVPKRNGKGGPENRLEMYSKASPRYFTVTGAVYQYGTICHAQDELDWLVDKYMPQRLKDNQSQGRDLSHTPSLAMNDFTQLRSSKSDHALIEKAKVSNPKFRQLWSGEDVLGDDSANDMALCNHLAFWLGRDTVRMDTAFRLSGLMRPKWDEKRGQQTYGELTLQKAIGCVTQSYQAGGRMESPIFEPMMSLPILSPMDFSAPLKTPETLIQNYVPRESVGMIWGEPGSFKSFLAIAWSLHIATGRPWGANKVSRGNVWYLANEGVNGLRRRVDAWLKHNGVSASEIEGRFFLPSRPIVMNDQSGEISGEVLQLAELVQNGVYPAVIVVDTLARAMTGDENSAKDAGAFIRALDYLVTMVRNAGQPVCIMLIHHSRKDSETYRGSSALRGAIDFEYSLTRRGNSGSELNCLKMKDQENSQNVLLAPKIIELGCQVDNHGDLLDLTSLVLQIDVVNALDDTDEVLVNRMHGAAIDIVRQQWEAADPLTSKDDLENALPKSIARNIRRRAIDATILSGWIQRIVVDKARYALVNPKKGAYLAALSTVEHDAFLLNKKPPERINIPPPSIAVPLESVTAHAVEEAKVRIAVKQQKSAAKTLAQEQMKPPAADGG